MREGVVAVLVRGSRVLLIRRGMTVPFAGYWAPPSGKLEPGDILVRIDGELVAEFVPLAAILDDSVDKSITVELERGGRAITEEIEVGDLHAISPSEFLEFGDTIVHDLSYQQARHYNREIEGVYVANPGYMLSRAAIPRGAVISFRDNSFANPEALIGFITRQAGTVKLRPDHKLVYQREWADEQQRLRGVRRLMTQLAELASAPAATAAQ